MTLKCNRYINVFREMQIYILLNIHTCLCILKYIHFYALENIYVQWR